MLDLHPMKILQGRDSEGGLEGIAEILLAHTRNVGHTPHIGIGVADMPPHIIKRTVKAIIAPRTFTVAAAPFEKDGQKTVKCRHKLGRALPVTLRIDVQQPQKGVFALAADVLKELWLTRQLKLRVKEDANAASLLHRYRGIVDILGLLLGQIKRRARLEIYIHAAVVHLRPAGELGNSPIPVIAQDEMFIPEVDLLKELGGKIR